MRLEFERKAATKRARWKILSAVQRHGVEVDEDSNMRGPLMSQIWENLVNEYAIVPSADARLTGRALGIDVGGTSVKAAVVDVASGQLVTERIRERTLRRATPEALCWKKWGGEFSELLARYETADLSLAGPHHPRWRPRQEVLEVPEVPQDTGRARGGGDGQHGRHRRRRQGRRERGPGPLSHPQSGANASARGSHADRRQFSELDAASVAMT